MFTPEVEAEMIERIRNVDYSTEFRKYDEICKLIQADLQNPDGEFRTALRRLAK